MGCRNAQSHRPSKMEVVACEQVDTAMLGPFGKPPNGVEAIAGRLVCGGSGHGSQPALVAKQFSVKRG
jgi:hypothetical protein